MSESPPRTADFATEMLVPELALDESLLLDGEIPEVCCTRRPLDEPVNEEPMFQLQFGLDVGPIFDELGHGCTSNVAHCKELLTPFLPLSESDVARLLGVLARTHSRVDDAAAAHATLASIHFGTPPPQPDPAWLTTWYPDVLLDAIKQLKPNLNWLDVVKSFDHDGFFVPDQKAFQLLISFYTKSCREPFPVKAVCERVWTNALGQLSFLKYAITAPSDAFSFASSPRRQVLPEKFPHATANSPWMSLDLLQILCLLAEAGYADDVRSLLEHPKSHCPELLLTGFVQVKTDFNLLQTEYCTALFKAYIHNQNASLVLRELWVTNKDVAIRCVVESYTKESGSRLLELFQDLKVLTAVLNGFPFPSGIELAALAMRREYFFIEGWLNDNLIVCGEPFFKDCLKFLQDRSSELPINILSSFFKSLQSFSGNVSRELLDEMDRIYAAAVRANPPLSSSSTTEFSSDVEEEANSYFDMIFSDQLTIEGVVDMLRRFNSSSNDRERQICSCMIKCLFDEYKFFPRFPDKELKMTAILYGKLIKHQLVASISLGVALRGVIDALRKPPDSKMFTFGINALEQFTERLVEWPPYCNHLLQISHMRDGHMNMIEFIERVVNKDDSGSTAAAQAAPGEHMRMSTIGDQVHKSPSMQLDDRPSSGGVTRTFSAASQLYDPQDASKQQTIARPVRTASVPVRPTSSTPGFGHALNIETLIAAAELRPAVERPSEEVENKVSFIINNLSKMNCAQKAKECLDILDERHFPWFAQYMVMKRASTELNYHDLYFQLFDEMKSKTLLKEVVKSTYENCKALLKSKYIKTSSEERTLLKNLGSWLGKLTIGRNQVLRAREIDPKTLILEAYEKGLMIGIIPFTAKILEPCQHSEVYRPPNPWTMAILNLLAEIYSLPNLKMNLKFDIEVLFNKLGVDMKEIKPSNLLKGKTREIEGNPDFSTKDIVPPAEQSPLHALQNVEFLSDIPSVSSHATAAVQSLPQDEDKAYVPDRVKLPPHTASYATYGVQAAAIVVNNTALAPHQTQQVQKYLPALMDRAMREILGPIVERSVTIACMTGRELVTKDFALETDESRVMNAAKLMITNLAGSLAHVTCKESLRVSLGQQVREHLARIGVALPPDMLETTINNIVADNLELGCAIFQRTATEKALREVEDVITPAWKKAQRDAVLTYSTGSVTRLPEMLRPKPGRLSPFQHRVYEDFGRFPWRAPSPRSVEAVPETTVAEGVVYEAARAPEQPEPVNAEPGLDIVTGGSPRDSDPTGLREQVLQVFEEWARLSSTPGASDQVVPFISQLLQSTYFKSDDMADRFFKILTEVTVAHSLSTEPTSPPIMTYTAVDMYAKLVATLVKFYGVDPSRVNLLNKVLSVTVRIIQKDAEDKKTKFQPRPYYRLFFIWLSEFNTPDQSVDSQILGCFANALTALQPLKVPGWSFVWLELISHRMFMPKQLLSQSQKGWQHFQRLLVALFKFMDPYLRSAELCDPVRLLYKGTLRVLLVLLHDFPEFLCEYHFSFCDVIPPSCIQMRNLILSAFPRNMRLPDPFTPNLKVDLLPEISLPPIILSDVEAAVKSKQMKGDIDEYLKTRVSSSNFLGELKQRLLLPAAEVPTAGTRYSVPLMNSLVLYVGMTAITQLQNKTTPQQFAVPTTTITHSAPMDIFQTLIGDLDTEGRYLFLNAIANQLRYPNNHTHYFSCVLLYLFAEANQEIIQEQITRVLLERLIVNRPHPWGLLITFIELIKNPRYSFWQHGFTRCAPEIEKLFDSVARSCMKPAEEESLPAGLNSEAD